MRIHHVTGGQSQLASKALLLLQGPDVVVGTDVDGLYSRWLSKVLEVGKEIQISINVNEK